MAQFQGPDPSFHSMFRIPCLELLKDRNRTEVARWTLKTDVGRTFSGGKKLSIEILTKKNLLQLPEIMLTSMV